MNEELNQKISQFLDDDLDRDEAIGLLQKMRTTPELTQKLNRYEAISHALKTDVFIDISTDFSARISQQIEQEPVYFSPKAKSKIIIKPHYKQWALAASVAVCAVLVERGLNTPTLQPIENRQALQVASSQTKQATIAPETEALPTPSLNARINEYLQAHNSSVYATSEAELKPFTRVTAYNQQ
ncbi:hypothetical protein JCM14076_30770 [Methylosoma difficile]